MTAEQLKNLSAEQLRQLSAGYSNKNFDTELAKHAKLLSA